MGKKVPISVDNIAFERLDLSRHYLTIDCDFTCYLVLNPSGEIPLEGTDICALHVGAWQIDAWTLLTKKDFPNQAGFIACLVWDKTLISDSVHAPQCVESDIDISNSVSTLKGQPVNITGFSMPQGESLPVTVLRNGVEVAVNNPFPASMVVNGAEAGPTNPVPSGLMVNNMPVGVNNPVPVAVNGSVPAVMIANGGAVSMYNPLLVSSVSQRYFDIYRGQQYPISLFFAIGAFRKPLEGGLFDDWFCNPTSYYLYPSVGSNRWLGNNRGVITDFAGDVNCTKYREIYGRVIFRREIETGSLVNIRYEGLYSRLNEESAPPLENIYGVCDQVIIMQV